ncbi:hypothetical protein KR018_007686 [Drosophila ironensis]|nr:hypothetical protein KR018_007686 [Drosophila ironensis]
MGEQPPLPPPNANMKSLKYYKHLQDLMMMGGQDVVDGEEEDLYEDSMSLSSTCMQRNHPYNNSQRPLLGDRRPQLTVVMSNATGSKKAPVPPQRTYISPYVQQQKRDSAKGLHGFNDFDALSQQYNQHLQSPHIGYPYGSPPSPTAQASDFCFDRSLAYYHPHTNTHPHPHPHPHQIHQQISSSSSSNCSTSTSSPTRCYQDLGQPQVLAPRLYPSCFEDDFSSATGGGGGPFIFGVAPEQQATDYGCTPLPATPTQQRSPGPLIRSPLQQSLSDTSAASSGKGTKFLLRKRKSKKSSAATVIVADAAATDKNNGQKAKSHQQPSIKCVLVGDGAVGKTNLILSYLENRFNPEHIPTASDIYNADVNVNESPVHLTICDTAGQDTLDPLRELCYPDSDVFLLCFSVVKPESFRAIKAKWAPKFAKTKAALILVGTQADLRTNPSVINKLQTNGEKAISYADAWDLATTIGAKYIETSSATQDKVKDVFDTAIWEGLVPTTLPPTPSFWRKLFCLA